MQKINGQLTADTITANSISVSDLTAGDTIIGKTVTLGARQGTSESPIKYHFINCDITFTGAQFGVVDLTFTNCRLTSANGATPDIGGKQTSTDDFKVTFYNCSGTVKIGALQASTQGTFYVNACPNLTIARLNSSYQYCRVFVDGEIELYNKDSGYTSINGSEMRWEDTDNNPSSYNAAGLQPGYALYIGDVSDYRKLIVHFYYTTSVLNYPEIESEVVINIIKRNIVAGVARRGNTVALMENDLGGSPGLLYVTLAEVEVEGECLIGFMGAALNDTMLTTQIRIDSIRGIL